LFAHPEDAELIKIRKFIAFGNSLLQVTRFTAVCYELIVWEAVNYCYHTIQHNLCTYRNRETCVDVTQSELLAA